MAEYQPVIFVRLVFSGRPIFLAKQHITQIKAGLPGFPRLLQGAPVLQEPLLQSPWPGESISVREPGSQVQRQALLLPLASLFPQS